MMSRLNVLVGDVGPSPFGEAVRRIISDIQGGHLGDFHVMWHAAEIARLAVPLHIDCHVLFMNNLWYEGRERPVFDLLEASLRFLQALRMATDAPVVAVFACPDDADYPARLYGAGADFVVRAPFEPESFRRTMQRLLANCREAAESGARKGIDFSNMGTYYSIRKNCMN